MGAFVASADVEGAFEGIRHEDVGNHLLQKGVHPGAVCSLLRESCDLKGKFARRSNVWKDVTCGTRCWMMLSGNQRHVELASDLLRTIVKPTRGVTPATAWTVRSTAVATVWAWMCYVVIALVVHSVRGPTRGCDRSLCFT